MEGVIFFLFPLLFRLSSPCHSAFLFIPSLLLSFLSSLLLSVVEKFDSKRENDPLQGEEDV